MKDSTLEDSLVTIENEDHSLAAYLDNVRDEVREKSDFDYKAAEKSTKLYQSIRRDYEVISKRIREQNERTRLLLDYFKDIGKKEGVMKKLGAAGKFLGTALSRIPVVKQTKNMFLDAGPVSQCLEDQFKYVVELNAQINEKINSDSGMRHSLKTIGENCRSYRRQITKLKDDLIRIDATLDNMQEQRDYLLKPLLEKYHALDIDSIDLLEIDAESSRQYEEIENINSQINDLQYSRDEMQELGGQLVNQLDGSKSKVYTIGIYIAEGVSLYGKIKAITDSVATHQKVMGDITDFEVLSTQAGEMATNLMQNFNDIFEKTAEHGALLAKEGDNLVPKYVYRGSTLKKVDENTGKALVYLEKSGQLGQYKKALGSGQDMLKEIENNPDKK